MLLNSALISLFLSTPSARRATANCPASPLHCFYFYPRPPRGGRLRILWNSALISLFLSTPSARRATYYWRKLETENPISIHALREEGDRRRPPACRHRPISIHALREEGDSRRWSGNSGHADFYPRPPRGGRPLLAQGKVKAPDISIHALREEGDRDRENALLHLLVFLSTPSARRATAVPELVVCHANDFYPRPPRGGRHVELELRLADLNFYPRPPRGGRLLGFSRAARVFAFLSTPSARRATTIDGILRRGVIFLSTPSARRATKSRKCQLLQHIISIHALREEGDTAPKVVPKSSIPFLSTPSARRATHVIFELLLGEVISIHALREEGDSWGSTTSCLSSNFYPRPPRGGRPARRRSSTDWRLFLSTPSARRATC